MSNVFFLFCLQIMRSASHTCLRPFAECHRFFLAVRLFITMCHLSHFSTIVDRHSFFSTGLTTTFLYLHVLVHPLFYTVGYRTVFFAVGHYPLLFLMFGWLHPLVFTLGHRPNLSVTVTHLVLFDKFITLFFLHFMWFRDI